MTHPPEVTREVELELRERLENVLIEQKATFSSRNVIRGWQVVKYRRRLAHILAEAVLSSPPNQGEAEDG